MPAHNPIKPIKGLPVLSLHLQTVALADQEKPISVASRPICERCCDQSQARSCSTRGSPITDLNLRKQGPRLRIPVVHMQRTRLGLIGWRVWHGMGDYCPANSAAFAMPTSCWTSSDFSISRRTTTLCPQTSHTPPPSSIIARCWKVASYTGTCLALLTRDQ